MIDFTQSFQVRARSQEEAIVLFNALKENGCRWNSGNELNTSKTNWGIYKGKTIYDVWCYKRDYGHVLYGCHEDPTCETYDLHEFLQELYGEDNDSELNIESLL